MPAPVTAILDNFNRADGALGANWTQAVSTYSMPTIVSNKLDWPTFPSCAWNTVFAANQEAFVKTGGGATSLYFLLRFNGLNTGTETGYVVFSDINGGTACEAYKWTAGSGSAVSLGYDGFAVLATDTYLWANITGTTISLYGSSDGITWGLRKTWVDSAITGSGKIGLWNANNTLPSSLEDFGGGSLVSGQVAGPGRLLGRRGRIGGG